MYSDAPQGATGAMQLLPQELDVGIYIAWRYTARCTAPNGRAAAKVDDFANGFSIGMVF